MAHLGIDGKEKPVFGPGEAVLVQLPNGLFSGRVRGIASENVIDFWIVEFDSAANPAAPYTCATVPHICMRGV